MRDTVERLGCILCVTLFLAVLSACGGESAAANTSEEQSSDWRSEWAVKEGFSIDVDTEGYEFPSAIAFVPEPGDDPGDPLYFVTELRGKVKVVTNDRTVHTFADDFFPLEPEEELPSGRGETGLAGVCLAPEQGYVFVTLAYKDDGGVLRNNVVRFETEPNTFAIEPTAQREFTDVFSPYESGLAHQIGPCQVKDDRLYVSVGDAWQPTKAQDLDFMGGKIVRMTLDGKPVPDNPFYQDDDLQKARNYVWTYGHRNPFGMKVVDDRLFIADNGPNLDRFLDVRQGENYLWNGTDWSIGTNADFVLSPSLAPVQIDYYDEERSFFPDEYERTFFVALAGSFLQSGKIPGIITFGYDFQAGKLRDVPERFLKYLGTGPQSVVGLGLGPDGLYFVPLFPTEEETSAVLKITHAPDRNYPYTLIETADGFSLMQEKGCLGCHSIDGDWGFGGTAGPPLDPDDLVSRLDERLHSDMYLESLQEIDRLDREPQRNYSQARREVREAEGLERVRVWLKYRIMEPRFDNTYSQMPNLGISEAEADVIADYLVTQAVGDVEPGVLGRIEATLKDVLPPRYGRKDMLASFTGGFVLGGGFLALAALYWPYRRKQEQE